MNRKGIVMEINKEKVGILTSGGEFIYVKTSNPAPSIGEIYESEEVIRKSSIYKNIKKLSVIAASLFIIFLCSTFIIAYNTPVSAVTIKINPYIKLEANRWNKIIKITPLNKDGTHIIKELNLKNKNLEKGINLILEEAKKENYINEDYKNSSKIISLDFTGNTSKLNLNNIENYLKNLKVKYNIKTSEVIKTNFTDHKDLKDTKSNSNKDKPFNNNNNSNNNNGNNNKTSININNKNNNSSSHLKSKNSEPENKKYTESKENNTHIKENNKLSNENPIKSQNNQKNNNTNENSNSDILDKNSKNKKDEKQNSEEKKHKEYDSSLPNKDKETSKKKATK